MLGNLHPKYRSRLKGIQLVALCKSKFIKEYSMDAILQPVVEDLKKLVSQYGYTFRISYRGGVLG